jgi:hypothetical protein
MLAGCQLRRAATTTPTATDNLAFNIMFVMRSDGVIPK